MKHNAEAGRRAVQIREFYERLPKTAKGRLTAADTAKWVAWLDAFGISRATAKKIMSGSDEKQSTHVIGKAMLEKYADRLRRHGYKVTGPDE